MRTKTTTKEDNTLG